MSWGVLNMKSLSELFSPFIDAMYPVVNKDLVKNNEQRLKHIFVDHAQGANRKDTSTNLSALTEELNQSARSICKSVMLDDKKQAILDQDIYALLASFNINIAEGIYSKDNLPNDYQQGTDISLISVVMKDDNSAITCSFYKKSNTPDSAEYEKTNFDINIIQKENAQYQLDLPHYATTYSTPPSIDKIIANDFKLIMEKACENGYIINLNSTHTEQSNLNSSNLSSKPYIKLINKSANLHQLLCELSYSNVRDVESLLMQINSIHKPGNVFKACLAAISFGALTTYTLYALHYEPLLDFFRQISRIINHIDKIVPIRENLPFFAICWQGILLACLLYNILFLGLKLDHYRTAAFIFQTLQICLRIAAYTTIYLAKGIVSSLIGSPLLIVSASIDLMPCIYYPLICLISRLITKKPEQQLIQSEWVKAAMAPRDEYNHDTRETFLTPIFFWNLFAAITITAIVVTNITCPPSIAITLLCLVAPLVISFVKDYMVQRQVKHDINERQRKISQINNDEKPQKSHLQFFPRVDRAVEPEVAVVGQPQAANDPQSDPLSFVRREATI